MSFVAELAVMDKGVFVKTYNLLAADGTTIISETPGTLGGNSKAGIYGRLDCTAANGALSKGYAQHRVFFANEQDAIKAGYRPCGRCMRAEYKEWKSGPEGNGSYPWQQLRN
ncbi:Ada metal-binding domain-containing protein [Marinobacter sp.]|uniref:Ada metal-binding domain-containing protein n=1 Tax=Marinobacter sp. TaxID=50741 RepID=UPI002357CA7C|nr:Ada metal-binding domain-containing protein [Marinobacter sp.]